MSKEEEYLANWKRAQADLENYKKEETKRMGEFVKFAAESVIIELIAVLDNLSEALKFAPEGSLKNGLESVTKQFDELLEKYGVKKIKTAGEKFDPSLHEAVEGAGDKIEEEIRSGYTLHDKVLRPARVKLEVKK